jgi:hypothetical protein
VLPVQAILLRPAPRSTHGLRKDQVMTTRLFAIATFCFAVIAAQCANAGAKDYEFQPVSVDVKSGPDREVAVRLVDKRTGKPIAGAVIFRTRLDMSPDSMDEMTAPHAAMASSEPGIYRFKADITMAGGWALKLQAKVPGEAETIQGAVTFKAK